MVRTQIQLTEEQAARLRDIAARRRTSVAELVREGVQWLLTTETKANREELVQRFLAGAGSGRSGRSDISTRHDDYLEEAFRS